MTESPDTPRTIVVVGAGLAAAKAVEALQDKGFDGIVIVFGDEERPPYERPPLSKDYLSGKSQPDEFTVHPASWYAEHGAELRLGTEVTAIDPDAHRVELADGSTAAYDRLLLATGSGPRVPPIPGADAAGVHYLRTLDDAEGLRDVLTEGSTLAVVGGGWIGLEVAATARDRGVAVTVVESAELPLVSVLGARAAATFAALHREHGVDLRTSTTVAEITADGDRVTGLRLEDGATVSADAVLVATGAQPNVDLAESAGLTLAGGGVAVDAALRTSAADVWAVGDIAAAEHPLLGTRVRTEHWANALKQPAVAVAGMLGELAQYDELPYFFSDQYDLGLEYVGHAGGADLDRVVFRGNLDGREYTAFWSDADGRVLAAMNVNVWEGLDDLKALIRSGRSVDPARLTDPDVRFAEL